MSFSASWHTLLNELDELPDGATLRTPLSGNQFRISDVQEQRIVIEFLDRDIDPNRPLQREQFETMYTRITDEPDGFELDRLPPDADPYPAVWSLHPRFEIDEQQGVIVERDGPTGSQLVETEPDTDVADADRTEPDLAVYADALLLIDALERHDMDSLEGLSTAALVNLYTLLSDVQRNANELRTDVRSVLLSRLHHDQPISGQYGSVQRTSRRNRTLKDDETVLETLEAAGIDRERVTSVDSSKVDEALEVVEVAESEVYDIDESEYVRKAEIHDEQKETRLQGLKNQLAAAEGSEAEELQDEIEELEARIEELTEFESGTAFHTRSEADP
jgi:molecular chaperone DnaK (HSP70)